MSTTRTSSDVDISLLDSSYRAVVFVGAKQSPPKAAKRKDTAHRFSRVEFLKIEGSPGKNALDFHIAFHLGRTFETSPEIECFVLSRDKGFDALLAHLNKNGLKASRITSIEELLFGFCPKCSKFSTIEHHGGRWCNNCGCFVIQPDAARLPSNQPGYREPPKSAYRHGPVVAICGWCGNKMDTGDGIYDDGEWMCGGCMGG